jgi:hypothetical protein
MEKVVFLMSTVFTRQFQGQWQEFLKKMAISVNRANASGTGMFIYRIAPKN